MDLLELVSRVKFYVDDKAVERSQHTLEKMQKRLEFLGAAEKLRGLREIVERFSGLGEQLQSAATSAGLTVEELQKLQYAGSMAAVSGEEMGTALTHLTRTLYAAKQGGAEAAKHFEDIGISREQIAGFRTGKDAMAAMADRFAGIQDPIKKQALAQELLGRGSSKMVGFLSKGSKAIGEMGREAEDVGAILSGPQVRALADVEDSLSQLWQVVRTFTAGIAASVAPAVQYLVGQMLQLYKSNRAFIQLNMRQWFDTITYAMGYVYGLVEGLTIKFMRFAREHGELVKWTGYLALGLGALAIAGGLVSTVIGGISAAFGAISILFSPLVIGVAAVTLAIHDLWVMLHGGSWEDTWLAKMLTGAKEGMGWVLKQLGIGPDRSSMVIDEEGVPTSIRRANDNMVALSGMQGPGGVPLSPGAAAAAAGGSATINTTAPITINVPPGTDPRMVGQAAKDGVREHLDQLAREMRRSLKPAQAY